MARNTRLTRQAALLTWPCPACASDQTVWIDRDLWECPTCGYEWREGRAERGPR